jgi:hypothetical protein
MSDEDLAEELNTHAYLAMSRLHRDVRAALAKLFRSGVPISQAVRDAIADAFEGKSVDDRVTFEVSNQKAGPLGDYADRIGKFQRDMAIARFIQDRRDPPHNMTLDDAAAEAEEHFGIGIKTCKAAVQKARKMEAWVERVYPQRPRLLATLSGEQYRHHMEIEYHFLMEEGRLEEGPRFS